MFAAEAPAVHNSAVGWIFPSNWSVLEAPHARAEVMRTLQELSDPLETRKWLAPDPAGPIVGFDEVVQLLFSDFALRETSIGWCFFDETEAALVLALIAALDVIIDDKPKSDAAVLAHPGWSSVEREAQSALDHLSAQGLATWRED